MIHGLFTPDGEFAGVTGPSPYKVYYLDYANSFGEVPGALMVNKHRKRMEKDGWTTQYIEVTQIITKGHRKAMASDLDNLPNKG